MHDVVIVPDETIKYTIIIGFDFIRNSKLTWNGSSYYFENLRETETNNIFNIKICNNIELPPLYDDAVKKMKDSYFPAENCDVPVMLKIVPTDDKPISCSPSKLPLVQQKIVNTQVKEWLEKILSDHQRQSIQVEY